MNEEIRERFTRRRAVPLLERLEARIASLSSGDRTILYALVFLAGVASLFSLYSLERHFLVHVPAYGGSLSEGIVGSPRFINPLLAMSDADRDLTTLTYAGLMGLTPDGTLEPVVAERYETSADGKSYTFTIRDGATFSDGTSITADDVVFTVQKAQDPAIKSPHYADWSGVHVTAIDRRTVRFVLDKPYAPFLGLTTIGILPSRLWERISDEEFPFSTLQTNPVGAGPFKMESVSRDASGLITSIRLSANHSYALGRPYLDQMNFTFFSRADDLAKAVANGSVESAYDVGRADARTAPYARVFAVFFNPNEKQVFTRLEVRKALSLALDRDGIVADVLGGYATPIIGPVPPGGTVSPTAVPASADPIDTAADVLEASGWKYDANARAWQLPSAKLTLSGITLRTSNVAELKGVSGAVKTAWEKLGIPVTIELYEPGDLSQNVIRPRKYETLLYGLVIGRDHDLYAFWDSQERNDPGLNIALYANKTVDALLESVRSAQDGAKRTSDLQKIENTIAGEYPAAFIYAPDFAYSIPKDLEGVALPQIIVPADRFAGVEKWYRETDDVWPAFVRAKQ